MSINTLGINTLGAYVPIAIMMTINPVWHVVDMHRTKCSKNDKDKSCMGLVVFFAEPTHYSLLTGKYLV
jgi:hypothetical protein